MTYRGTTLDIDHVLVDTGSATSVFSADALDVLGILPEPGDALRRIHGVGGSEFVFVRRIQELAVGEVAVTPFVIEVGSMDYDFEMNGILGMDFLVPAKALLDLGEMQLTFASIEG